MDNQLVLDNYLLILKSTVEVYVHGTLESSNKDVRLLLKQSLDEIMTSQASTYDLMTKYNWYNVENVKTSVINKTLNKVKKK